MSAGSRLQADGFSLVEVAISLAILSVGMVGVLALLPVGLDSARQVHAETVASQIVRSAIADFSTNGFQKGTFDDVAGVGNGSTWTTAYYTQEGSLTNAGAASAYFRLDYIKGEGTAAGPSCRYFLQLAWPSAAPTNSVMAQSRTFVTDVVRSY